MKNSDDTIGNRTRDLSACSAIPQPTCGSHSGGKLSAPFWYRIDSPVVQSVYTELAGLKQIIAYMVIRIEFVG